MKRTETGQLEVLVHVIEAFGGPEEVARQIRGCRNPLSGLTNTFGLEFCCNQTGASDRHSGEELGINPYAEVDVPWDADDSLCVRLASDVLTKLGHEIEAPPGAGRAVR